MIGLNYIDKMKKIKCDKCGSDKNVFQLRVDFWYSNVRTKVNNRSHFYDICGKCEKKLRDNIL